MPETVEKYLNEQQKGIFAGLTSPALIQAYLDRIPYSTDEFNRCPLRVIQDGAANCMDGALLAAAALRRLGHAALIVDMLPEPGTDDDHILALYRQNGRYGAVAKSNFTGLRSREPVYSSLRELMMSYFDFFYNVEGMKTLRGYNRPLRLAAFDSQNWEISDDGVVAIEQHLYDLKPISLLSPEMTAALTPMDEISYQAGLLGSDPRGLFKVHSG